MSNFTNNQELINLYDDCKAFVKNYNDAFNSPDINDQKKCADILAELIKAEGKYNDKIEELVYSGLCIEEYPFFEAAKTLTFTGVSHADDIQTIKMPGSDPVSIKVGIKLTEKENYIDFVKLSQQIGLKASTWYFEMVGTYQHIALVLGEKLAIDGDSVKEKLKVVTDTLDRLKENERKGINNGSASQLKKTVDLMAKEILTYRQKVDVSKENGNFVFTQLKPRTKDELKALKAEDKKKGIESVYPEEAGALNCDVAFIENAITSKGKGKVIKLMSIPKFFEVLYVVMNRIATQGKYELDVRPGMSTSLKTALLKTSYAPIGLVDPFAGD